MHRIGFFVNSLKPAAAAARERLSAAAERLGLEVADAPKGADAVIALGGDGTILKCVHEFPGAAVLGFNLGGLGYLSSVEARDFERALASLAEGRFRLVQRTMLEVRGGDGSVGLALNDVVFSRELTGHAAALELTVDGRTAADYLADGIVIATPTGSTAYSLAAGGPVLMPDTASFVVTPMNPHALGVRPMVVPDGVSLTVTLRRRTGGRAERVGVYADGENVMTLVPDEPAVLVRSPQTARFVELEGSDPYAVLSRKLGWPGANVK